eukprot:10447408-Lingulodinium_polyedra.AAC.1
MAASREPLPIGLLQTREGEDPGPHASGGYSRMTRGTALVKNQMGALAIRRAHCWPNRAGPPRA